MADYRRQFEKTARREGEDPSIFAIALETLAAKVFGDTRHTARLRLICDQFIAGHDSCDLRRHLDGVSPETPIWDIVDRCWVWESHADTVARMFGKPSPGRALPIFTVNEPGCGLDDRMVAAVTIPPAELDPFAQTIAPHSGSASVASQASAHIHVIGKFATANAGGGAGTKARSAS